MRISQNFSSDTSPLPWQLTWLAIVEHSQVSTDVGTRLSLNQKSKFHLMTSAGKRSNQCYLS